MKRHIVKNCHYAVLLEIFGSAFGCLDIEAELVESADERKCLAARDRRAADPQTEKGRQRLRLRLWLQQLQWLR